MHLYTHFHQIFTEKNGRGLQCLEGHNQSFLALLKADYILSPTFLRVNDSLFEVASKYRRW